LWILLLSHQAPMGHCHQDSRLLPAVCIKLDTVHDIAAAIQLGGAHATAIFGHYISVPTFIPTWICPVGPKLNLILVRIPLHFEKIALKALIDKQDPGQPKPFLRSTLGRYGNARGIASHRWISAGFDGFVQLPKSRLARSLWL
jgi:hypothetical protein